MLCLQNGTVEWQGDGPPWDLTNWDLTNWDLTNQNTVIPKVQFRLAERANAIDSSCKLQR